ncbi:hypothetical protein B0H11DRAFT_2257324 [Mycena galericulata]|nr:hypothetical protein B0H11DRAFT_2257324 [Mycena galericulata]
MVNTKKKRTKEAKNKKPSPPRGDQALDDFHRLEDELGAADTEEQNRNRMRDAKVEEKSDPTAHAHPQTSLRPLSPLSPRPADSTSAASNPSGVRVFKGDAVMEEDAAHCLPRPRASCLPPPSPISRRPVYVGALD